MNRLNQLKKRIDALYQGRREGRADWADWLYEHHVFVVADKAGELAPHFGANEELCRAAGMLHDVADAVMSRLAQGHEEKSAEIARDFLRESGYQAGEVGIIVDDAIMRHSCRGIMPETPEGRVVATADALVHITSDFYDRALMAQFAAGMLPTESGNWALQKIERDFNTKILFPALKEQVRKEYELTKARFKVLTE